MVVVLGSFQEGTAGSCAESTFVAPSAESMNVDDTYDAGANASNNNVDENNNNSEKMRGSQFCYPVSSGKITNNNNNDGGGDRDKLMLYVRLFEHAYECRSTSTCTSTNCADMKRHLQHARTCRTKIHGGCRICKRIWRLLQTHAQNCSDSAVCPVPQCATVKDKLHLSVAKPSSRSQQQDPQEHQPRNNSNDPNNNNNMVEETTTMNAPEGIPQQQQPEATTASLRMARLRLVDHASKCTTTTLCSFPGCAHTKKCLLRRRTRPGASTGGGCRTCLTLWSSLQQSGNL